MQLFWTLLFLITCAFARPVPQTRFQPVYTHVGCFTTQASRLQYTNTPNDCYHAAKTRNHPFFYVNSLGECESGESVCA